MGVAVDAKGVDAKGVDAKGVDANGEGTAGKVADRAGGAAGRGVPVAGAGVLVGATAAGGRQAAPRARMTAASKSNNARRMDKGDRPRAMSCRPGA